MQMLLYSYDGEGDVLTVWYTNPTVECTCEAAEGGVVVMRGAGGAVIGKQIPTASTRTLEGLGLVFPCVMGDGDGS